jgi:hypothetical protein
MSCEPLTRKLVGARIAERRWRPRTHLTAGMTPLFVFMFYVRLLTCCFDVSMKKEKERYEPQLKALTQVIQCLYFIIEIIIARGRRRQGNSKARMLN